MAASDAIPRADALHGHRPRRAGREYDGAALEHDVKITELRVSVDRAQQSWRPTVQQHDARCSQLDMLS